MKSYDEEVPPFEFSLANSDSMFRGGGGGEIILQHGGGQAQTILSYHMHETTWCDF